MEEQHSLNSIALEHRLTRLEEWYSAVNRAIELQATEYARRLEELNHENRRVADRDKMFLPRETFDQFEGELRNWRYSVNTTIATIGGRDKGLSLAWSMILGGISLLIGVTALYAALV